MTITALAKIYSNEYFCNTKVSGLGEIFEKFSPIRYMQIVEADVMLLTEIFPDASPSHIRDVRINTGLSLDKVVEVLLAKKPAAVVPTTQTLLENLASQVIDFNNDITIIVNRNVLYNKAKVWYKCAMADPSRLKKNLMIHFTGESGIDAGALRNEFFTRVLHDINEELFEGPPDRRIPKNLWDADKEFQMAGIIASHSILLGGPGFNCLHPLMYDWMINPSKEPMENLPTASDIPQTAANVDLIELISKVRCMIITLEKILMLWCRIQNLVYV